VIFKRNGGLSISQYKKCGELDIPSWVTELATGLDGVGGALVECPAELVWQCQEEQNEI